MTHADKIARRLDFLETCAAVTRRYQDPIIEGYHPNPKGLGFAKKFSETTGVGQSAVIFNSVAEYREANRTGRAPHGGAEYAIAGSTESERVCAKLTELH